MKLEPLPLSGCCKIVMEKIEDERGFFARNYCEDEFEKKGLEISWRQVNSSLTKLKGSVRGMHFQYPPKTEVKMVRCISGAIWDVVVDLRKGSDTFGRWCGVELSSKNKDIIYIPKGFAHGFQTLENNTELLYFHSESYSPEHEGRLSYDDEDVAINWPLELAKISKLDRKSSSLNQITPIVI